MDFLAGSAFLNQAAPRANTPTHLWTIISDPSQSPTVLIVNFTSWDDWPQEACIVEAGEHPFIKHKSYINYDDAQLPPLQMLQRAYDEHLITEKEPLTDELLQRIRESAVSPISLLKNRLRQILIEQGVA